MTLDDILGPVEKDDDIFKHCHVNENKDGDRFVGIKADSGEIMVYFPIGYELPKRDQDVRRDIKNLIHVLSEFSSKEDRLLAVNKFAAPQSVDFPINAYRNVIEYYLANNSSYYVETDPIFKTSARGPQDWPKTLRKQTPLVQNVDGVSSLIFTNFTVRSSLPNYNKKITQINRYCVYEAFKKLGWLYVPYMPDPPGEHPDIKTSISIVNSRLQTINDDKKKTLFKSMKSMLEYQDEKTSERQFYFGVDEFDNVWEKLIDTAFGEKDKDQYFPRTRWLLDYGKIKEKKPLIPDTIMIYNNKYYVLDAKCYRYGWTGIPDDLPNGTSINKQITYGEYLEVSKSINNDSLFNAFIMPFNMAKNYFNISEPIGNIGEAIGDWRYKPQMKNYERIQGIVMDTRYLMYHYVGNNTRDKVTLSECIEKVLSRSAVPAPNV